MLFLFKLLSQDHAYFVNIDSAIYRLGPQLEYDDRISLHYINLYQTIWIWGERTFLEAKLDYGSISIV